MALIHTDEAIDPIIERLNKPTEIREAFRQLLTSDQFDLYLDLFNFFSTDDQEALLEHLHEMHQEENKEEEDDDDDDDHVDDEW